MKKYFISVVHEMILNQDFLKKYGEDWITGRIEINELDTEGFIKNPYAEKEERFFTNKVDGIEYLDKIDFQKYTEEELNAILKIVKKEYNHNPLREK